MTKPPSFESEGRFTYGIEVRPDTASEIWSALIDVLADRATTARLDAYPDATWPVYATLGEPARRAHQELVAIAEARLDKKRDRKMYVGLDMKEPQHVSIVRRFGPHSICADVFESEEWERGVAHIVDEGYSCSAVLSEEELRGLRAKLRTKGIPETVVSPPMKRGRFGRYRLA